MWVGEDSMAEIDFQSCPSSRLDVERNGTYYIDHKYMIQREKMVATGATEY